MTGRRKACSGLPFTVCSMQYAALCVMLLISFGLSAQNKGTVDFTAKKLPFVHPERNEIVGAKYLDSFFYKLYLLRTQGNSHIHILQIGDSHIQADFLSDKIRTDLQHDFGNGGRGVVVPLHVAGSNEPFNYKITSNVKCSAKRCVFVDQPMPIGLGGVTIQTTNDSTLFDIKTFNYPPLNYGFNKMTLFYLKDSSS
ncbi:MAG TPA: hypothetical protein VG603_03575, partial [Chitinophagales bacterium]|nr:hypothetical protein [Chitinophagales bacterium]